MRDNIILVLSVVGAYISYALGGWDTALQSLVVFMAVDYLSGLLVAGVFYRSSKSSYGGILSKCSWQGLIKKCMQLLMVLVAYRLDLMIGIDFVRTAVIIGFISHELISITENFGLMGVPMPEKLYKAIDLLNGRKEGGTV